MSERDPKGNWLARQSFTSRGNVGVGRPIGQDAAGRLAQVTLEFPNYERGIDFRDAEQDQPAELTQESADFVVTERNRIRRAPGHDVVETMSGRSIRAMLLHTSLDFSVELLLFDGAWLGVKTSGATTWYNAGLPSGDEWVGIPNIDKFLFTNGAVGVYQRTFGGAGTVALIVGSYPAKTLANFAARVFAGGITVSSVYQALAIAWSADPEGLDWTGLGSGITFLIDNRATDDRLIALRPIGFDILVALCQKSIWIGRRTSDAFEPATFEPRVMGQGCIAESTIQVTPAGLVFLGEAGVYIFDGSQSTLISGPINDELLPLLTNVLSGYSSSYEQTTARYKLYTPVCTWIYDLRYNRWLKHRYVAHRAIAYSEQFSGVTWATILATWESMTETWASISAPLGQERLVLATDEVLAIENELADTYLDGETIEAVYGFLRRDTPDVNSVFETQRLRIRYVGADSSFEVWLPDINGVFVQVAEKALPNNVIDSGAELGMVYTGKGTGAQIQWTDPSLEISKAQIVGLLRSHKQGVL